VRHLHVDDGQDSVGADGHGRELIS